MIPTASLIKASYFAVDGQLIPVVRAGAAMINPNHNI
jgi:hypothetical protein